MAIMSNFNVEAEQRLLWGCSYKTIMHRWKLWQEWDIVYRISKMFGDESGDKPIKKDYDNSAEMFNKICQLLPSADKETIN